MRQFFITSLERAMNVLVVLTGLAILALSGRMALEAQGNPEVLLRALLLLLGGFVLLFAVAGIAYLAIDIRLNSRRMVRLLESGGRAAKPLVATRSAEDLPRARPSEVEEAPLDEESQPRRISRFAASVRAQTQPAAQPAAQSGLRRAEQRLSELRVAEPRVAEPRVTEPRVAEPRMAEPRVSEPRVAEPRYAQPRQMVEPLADDRYEDELYAEDRNPSRAAYDDLAPEQDAAAQARSGVFSGRGMPKLRAAQGASTDFAETDLLEDGYGEPAPRLNGNKPGRLVADPRPRR
ncbi:flagellar biosynthesis protein FlhF [Paracoccus aminophilus]|uniref:Uncharacterized protein n=1 Tax=Paracoccus aminophilus JCM 7686 TaxID=1367847 RepID=S5XWH2_PARAH|nr:hypothetical protein [Paracoccus aminophilus]AGT07760.1 hypothetical protein JCM7686_0651 [Paracoccus aminophilus JCM 7686]